MSTQPDGPGERPVVPAAQRAAHELAWRGFPCAVEGDVVVLEPRIVFGMVVAIDALTARLDVLQARVAKAEAPPY